MTPLTIDTPEQLRDLLGEDFTFSPQQFAAITAPLEPAVVVAGAGSGKTTVMAARVVWLVATGRVAPGEVLGLTFTTKATAELAKRIRDSLRQAGLLPTREPRPVGEDEEEVEEPTVATYHSYASSLLSEHGLRIGHEPDTRLIADASRYQLAARAVQRYTTPVEHLSDSPRHVVQYLLALDAEMSEHLVDPETVRSYDARQRPLFEAGMATEHRKTYRAKNEKAILAIDRRAELLGLVEAYRGLKAHLGLLDFSDQIALAARLAQQCPEVGAIERGKFKIVLLDEYQDTSVAQALMLSRLFSGPDPESGLGHPVTAVGDPNQAIYGWRGASVSNILEFAQDFPARDGRATTYPLTVNRRSDERILATANHLAADLYASRPELLPLEPKPGAAPGEVRAAVHETYDEELAWLADRVIEARAAMSEPSWKEIGVLTRDNAHAAAVFDALSSREIPVEIVGLKGLLRLPEVSEVVATLTLVQDVTANASLLTLLAGPRWAIGPRDLALLGRRARELAGGQGGGQEFPTVQAQLAAAVEGADPTEIPSLCDALEDPGDHAYSEEARQRFGLLADELRRLRSAIGEPILDLVRRIVDTTGIDVELASSVSPAAAARRDNLDLFVQAVAEFQAVDGQVTLAALLAWLEAEDEYGQGLDVATPSEADSVKLLTVHRAKGLEWDVVFLVGVTERKFPTNRTRSSWLTVPFVMPTELRGDARDLPQLAGHTPDDITALGKAAKAHEALEELRLGYVAWTRARHVLSVSAWCWASHLKTPLGPSDYLRRTCEAMEQWAGAPEQWLDTPPKGATSPYAEDSPDLAWPISHRTAEVERRLEAAARVRAARLDVPDAVEDMLLLDRIQQWDDEIKRLLDEAVRDRSPDIVVPLPLQPLGDVAGPAARRPRGVRPRPGQADAAAAVTRGPFRHPLPRLGRGPLRAAAPARPRRAARPRRLRDRRRLRPARAGQALRERPVRRPGARTPWSRRSRWCSPARSSGAGSTRSTPSGSTVTTASWSSTGRPTATASADPLQLAIYRVAWAELAGVPVERVRAAFYYVRTGEVVEPAGLPGREELERLVSPA